MAACGSATPPPAAPAEPTAKGAVERYLPLTSDSVYVYETTVEGSAEHGVLMLQITRHGEVIEFGVGGRVQRLQVFPNGVMNITGGWVLKGPLSKGAAWKGPSGRVMVSAIDQHSKVPAGDYYGCIETVEQSMSPGENRKITTTYCPDVGITSLVVEGQVGGDYQLERALLKSFGPKVDLGAAPQ